MTKKTYIIDYQCFSKSGEVLEQGKMRVKRAENGVAAQVRFEKFLQGKHPDFGRLVVKRCEEDVESAFADYLMGIFSP